MVLAFSIIVSIKTCVLSGSKLVKFSKEGFLPAVGKILLILSSLASVLARIGSLILYFGTAIGLLDLMHHWKQEQTRYRANSEGGPYEEGGNLTWYENTVGWDTIERTKALQQLPPDTNYSIYTGLTIKWLYVILIGGMVVHLILVYVLKHYTSSHFRYIFVIFIFHSHYYLDFSSETLRTSSRRCYILSTISTKVNYIETGTTILVTYNTTGNSGRRLKQRWQL